CATARGGAVHAELFIVGAVAQPNHWRIRTQGVDWIYRRRGCLVLHLDQMRAVLGGSFALRQDDRYRLTHVGRALEGHDDAAAFDGADQVMDRKVSRRQDGDNAWSRQRLLFV